MMAAQVQPNMRAGGTPRLRIASASTANPDVRTSDDSSATAGYPPAAHAP